MSVHTEHDIKYVMTNVVTEQAAQITQSGDVKVTGSVDILRIDGDTYIYCDTCNRRVASGRDGLSDTWEVLG